MVPSAFGRPSVRSLAFVLILGSMGTIGLSGCEDACSELADSICRCEPSEGQQSSCLRRVDAEASAASVTVAEQENCEKILDSETCSCDALAEGDYQACGLATQPPSSPQGH